MINYKYGCLGKPTIEELTRKLQARESVVLLGPQLIGKRFFLSHLIKHLKDLRYSTPVYATCHPIEEAVLGGDAWIKRCNPEAIEVPPRSNEIFSKVDEQLSNTGSALLIITNIDSLPYAQAREILIQIRTRVEDQRKGSLSVIITGEMSLTALVYGPNSEFNCANQYVVQGLDRELFRDYARLYAKALNVRYTPSDEALNFLFEQAGGNAQFLRLIYLDIHQTSGLGAQGDEKSLTPEDFERTIHSPRFFGEVLASVFHGCLSRIDRNANDLQRVHKLLLSGEAEANPSPELMELTGIAIRAGKVLRLFSPFVKLVLERYYTNRRLAELYFKHQNLKEAEECLIAPAHDTTPSIDRQEDASLIEGNVQWLIVQLYSRVHEGVESIQVLLEQGCRYLLDNTQVRLFVRRSRPGQLGSWWPVAGVDRPTQDADNDQEVDHLQLIMNQSERQTEETPTTVRNLYSVDPLADGQTIHDSFCVIVRSATGVALSPEFRRLLQDLLKHFEEAHRRAYAIEKTKIRNQRLNDFADIFENIIQGLGKDIIDVPSVLRLAAQRIRRLGYHRVLFSIVDPMTGEIRGAVDDSRDGVNLAELTRYRLRNFWEDIQSYVCVKKKTRIVFDAPNDRLANKQAVVKAGLKAFAVIPIISRSEWVIGTLHVERTDRKPLAADEIQDFEALAQRLAIALEQVERVNHLQNATDGLEEPLFVVDRTMRVRYANKIAGQLLGIESGWHGRDLNQPITRISTDISRSIEKQVKRTLVTREAILEHLPQQSPDPQTYELMTRSINSSFDDDVTVGVVGHVRDLTYLYRVFGALEKIQSCHDEEKLISTLLDAMKGLGHRWARLYLVSSEKPHVFQSRNCFGSEDQNFVRRFQSGDFQLKSAQEPGHESWICVNEKSPTVFYCAREGEKSTTIRSERGLVAQVIVDPQCPVELQKQPGDFWIDFPILRGADVLGKVTLACDPKAFGPEDLEFLKLLAKLLSVQLNAIKQSEEIKYQQYKRETMRKSVYHTCHNIGTRLGAYPALIWRYKRLSRQSPELQQINQDFERIHTGIQESIDRATRHLTPVTIVPKPCELKTFLETTFQRIVSEDELKTLDVETTPGLSIDTHVIEGVLCELVENSRHCLPEGKQLEVRVSAHRIQEGDDELIVIDYLDNGPGVKPESKEDIFKEFVSRRKGGTGLGLAYIRHVIEAHHGQVCEKGAFGLGVHIQIKLPLSSAT